MTFGLGGMKKGINNYKKLEFSQGMKWKVWRIWEIKIPNVTADQNDAFLILTRIS